MEGVLRHMSELAFAFPGVETGALALGPNPHTLTTLLPSGPHAVRTPGSFSFDPDFLNPELNKAKRLGLQWIGVWHVHPEGSPGPSITDLSAATGLLADPETELGGRLLMPISERSGSSIVTRFFVAEGFPVVIRQIACAVVSGQEHTASRQGPNHQAGAPSVPQSGSNKNANGLGSF